MSRGKFFITGAIYYPSALPHLGSAFEIIGLDVLARYKRLQGYDVLFVTGMDEHSQKTLEAARSQNLDPRSFLESVSGEFHNAFRCMGISHDDFIRTTEERHKRVVEAIFKKLYEAGDIYKDWYTGLYCSGCEEFLTQSQYRDGKCPQGHTSVERDSEEAYFFRLSKYTDRLRKHVETHPGFIQPEFRRTEIMNNFILRGLTDVCITRTATDWGISVPIDSNHVFYVWFDALANYLTGSGYGESGAKFERFWPADLHVVGKDIMRFHTTLWPAMLMSAGLELPERVFGHGFVTLAGGEKMSKSLGNVVDPRVIIESYGADALRYFLMREFPYSSDGEFSFQNLVERINSDLSDDLGNLVYRTLSMTERYFGGKIPGRGGASNEKPILEAAASLKTDVEKDMDSLQYNRALEKIWQLVRLGNRYVESSKPWELARNPSSHRELESVIYNLLEVSRLSAVYVAPFMPETSAAIYHQIGIDETNSIRIPESTEWGGLESGRRIAKGSPLFPKAELPPELVEMER